MKPIIKAAQSIMEECLKQEYCRTCPFFNVAYYSCGLKEVRPFAWDFDEWQGYKEER